MSNLIVIPERKSPGHRSILCHVLAGFFVIFGLLGGIALWASTTLISGAVIAAGTIVVSTHARKIQHPTGGVVREILVRNGSVVNAGELLLTLDETVLKANLTMVSKGLTELMLRKARLTAERDGALQIIFPSKEQLSAEIADQAIRSEFLLFETRRAARQSLKSQLHERIAQTRDELAGLQAQLVAKSYEISLVGTELSGADELWKQRLIAITKYTALRREAARLDGEHGQLTAAIALARGKITEIELKILQVDQDFSTEVGKELRETDYRINDMVERKVAAEDQFRRSRIVSPHAGIVHGLSVTTVGGVIAPGDDIMLIIPQREPLIAEVREQPQDIDQLHIGQGASLRFSAFDQSTTPDCRGELRHVSPDLTSDARTGATFYLVRIDVVEAEAHCLGSLALRPGMPVEAFLATQRRTVLSYLTKPLADQIARAFRDG